MVHSVIELSGMFEECVIPQAPWSPTNYVYLYFWSEWLHEWTKPYIVFQILFSFPLEWSLSVRKYYQVNKRTNFKAASPWLTTIPSHHKVFKKFINDCSPAWGDQIQILWRIRTGELVCFFQTLENSLGPRILQSFAHDYKSLSCYFIPVPIGLDQK